MNIVDVFRYASYISFALAGILLALTIYLFFALKIKDVMYELSGKVKAETTKKMVQGYSQTGSLRKTGMTDVLKTQTENDLNNGLMFTDGLHSGKTGSKAKTGSMKNASSHSAAVPAGQIKLTKDVVVVHTNEIIQFN